MHKLNVRPGDLMVNDQDSWLLVKQTKSFWYYLHKGLTARVSKENIWRIIDGGYVEVVHGSTMKRRRKQSKWRTLDLHGVKHEHAADTLRDYFNWVSFPAKVMTGHSSRMKQIVRDIAKEYNCICRESIDNSAVLIVEE